MVIKVIRSLVSIFSANTEGTMNSSGILRLGSISKNDIENFMLYIILFYIILYILYLFGVIKSIKLHFG